MHGHHTYEPLTRRGFTMLELVVGIALAAVIGLVCAGLFRAGIKSYNYSYRQTRVIYSARQAMAANGARLGMIWAAQTAASVDSLSVSTLSVTQPGDFSTSYLISNKNLYACRLAAKDLQAESVSTMTVSYYNLDANGHIMVSTAPEAVAMVTTQISMQGSTARDRTYNFMSGALVRNNQ